MKMYEYFSVGSTVADLVAALQKMPQGLPVKRLVDADLTTYSDVSSISIEDWDGERNDKAFVAIG